MFQEKSNSKSASGEKNTDKGFTHRLDLDFSWEIDIFGYVRRSIEAADAQLDAARSKHYRDVMVILYAEIARELYCTKNSQQERFSLPLRMLNRKEKL